jgi:hypothetical protein
VQSHATKVDTSGRLKKKPRTSRGLKNPQKLEVYLLCQLSLTISIDEKGKSPTYPIKSVRMVLKSL